MSRHAARAAVLLVLLLALPVAVIASAALPLSTIGDVRGLSFEDAGQGRPVRVRGVVTYYHHDWEMLFVQDGTGGIFVYIDRKKPAYPIRLGQRVEVQGKTVPGDFVASIGSPSIQPLGQERLPDARPVTLKHVANGSQDSLWIEVRGIVRSAKVVDDLLLLDLMTEHGRLPVHVQEWDGDPDFSRLVDAEVRARGVCTTLSNDRRQFAGAELWSPHLRYVTVEGPAADPFAQPTRSIGNLRRYTFAGGHERRLKVAGVVTLQQPGRGLFIQDETAGLLVHTSQEVVLQPGDRVEAVGFLTPGGDRPTLEEGLVRRTAAGAPPPPAVITTAQAKGGDFGARLVTIKAPYVGRLDSGGEELIVLQEGEVVFNARLGPEHAREALASLPTGSLLELTGVCAASAAAGPGHAFQVLLRSPADLVVVAKPSWWTPARLQVLSVAVTAVALLALVWVATLRARVRRQTAIIRERLEREAALEKRYRDLVENAHDLVFSLDADGRFASVNSAAERILGYSPEEMLGQTLSALAAPAPPAAPERGDSGPAEIQVGRYELEVLAKDRRTVVLEVSARRRPQQDGRSGLDGIARDVTERKRAERELRGAIAALRASG